jgi:exopolysaccharide biosynthesis WecB/TagA/CpsF family protein
VSQPAYLASERLVAGLIALERDCAAVGAPVRVAWVNHFSVRGALQAAPEAMRDFEVCGVDGLLLRWLLAHPARTSADLVVPLLLQADSNIQRVLAIGGRGDRSAPLSDALSERAGRRIEVHAVDGYAGLLRGRDLHRLIREVQPDLVLVGLGAGLQEQVVAEAAGAMTGGYAMTCGGFLDQVLQVNYYPSWAYPLRLCWLVRLSREPRRLWRRYTVDALRALATRTVLRADMRDVAGAGRHAALCAGDEVSAA